MTFWEQLKQWWNEFWSGLSVPEKPAPVVVLPSPEPAPQPEKPIWFKIAEAEIGVKEIPGEARNPRIAEYHKAAAFNGTEDDSWCSSFVCFVMEKAGFKSTNSPQARSWLKYGLPLSKPKLGAILIFWRESIDSWKGHVGFYAGETSTHYLVLGGNQDNEVKIKAYPKSQLLGIVWPDENNLTTLSWEAPDKSRAAWTNHLIGLVRSNLAVYDNATDKLEFFPKWDSLSEAQKVLAIGEFWVSLALYESGWNPKSHSVDVGTKGDRDTWSVGLYQMSVVDQKNLKINLGYDFNDLMTAIPNITLAHAVMVRQLSRQRRIALDNSSPARYWAVILHGNRYSKIEEIKARIKKCAPFVV